MSDNEDAPENQAEPYTVFLIKGEPVDPDQITEMLGISPSYMFKKGDLYGSKKERRRLIGFWSISSDDSVPGNDLELHIEWLLEHLEPVKENLSLIISEAGVEAIFKIVCNLWVHEWDEIISPSILKRITDLNAKFGISIYYLEDLNERLNGEKP